MCATTNGSVMSTTSPRSKKLSAKHPRTGSSPAASVSTKVPARASVKIPKLFKHQQQTVDLLDRVNRVYDTSSPGTGKTRAHLQAWWERRKNGGGKALVLAPKSLVEAAWVNDLEKFFPDATYSVVLAPNRAKALGKDADIYIANHDAVKYFMKAVAPVYWSDFDTLIVDEITAFKHRTSQRSQALAKLKNKFQHRSGLTGTPNSNTVTDVWHQILVLDDGRRLGKSFFAFRNATQMPTMRGAFTEWHDKPGAELAVGQLIGDMTVRHKLEDCIDIPPNHIYAVPYHMPLSVARRYKVLADDAVLQLRRGVVNAVNAASLTNKLLQVASGAVYTHQDYEVLDSSRYELVLDLIEQREHSLVFFNWRHQRDQLTKMADERGISFAIIDGETPISDRRDIVARYQEGAYKTLFLHPKTGAHGLTLTRGTCTIFASPIYEADLLEQAKHRIYRAGQTQKTETVLIEARGTIESKVYERLHGKHERMFNLLDMLEK